MKRTNWKWKISRYDDDHYLVSDGKESAIVLASCRKQARLIFLYEFEGYRMWRNHTVPFWREIYRSYHDRGVVESARGESPEADEVIAVIVHEKEKTESDD
jgi:hypothetical protein